MKKFYAVFGNPVLHSKSPQIFNPAFEDISINACYIRIRPQSAEDICRLMKAISVSGASITSPFKEEIFGYLDNISVDAKRIGAVNTVVNINGSLNGYNTDHVGVTESLQEAGITLKGSKCLVLGGGGAARAAVYGLINHGAEVYICNRTFAKAQVIADDFGCEIINWDNFNKDIKFDVVVSALLPEAVPPFLESLRFKHLLDASYKKSGVSEVSQRIGVNIIPGERWLIQQAAEAFKLFLQVSPSIKAMETELDKVKNKDDISILSYSLDSPVTIEGKSFDLLVSSQGLDALQEKTIINEEISKAFGS